MLVDRWSALGFGFRIFELFELGAGIRDRQIPFPDEEIEEGAEDSDLVVDGPGRDPPFLVLLTAFAAPLRFAL
jgi:hypothetical protein